MALVQTTEQEGTNLCSVAGDTSGSGSPGWGAPRPAWCLGELQRSSAHCGEHSPAFLIRGSHRGLGQDRKLLPSARQVSTEEGQRSQRWKEQGDKAVLSQALSSQVLNQFQVVVFDTHPIRNIPFPLPRLTSVMTICPPPPAPILPCSFKSPAWRQADHPIPVGPLWWEAVTAPPHLGDRQVSAVTFLRKSFENCHCNCSVKD